MSRNNEKNQLVLHRLHAAKAKAGGMLESNPNLRPTKVLLVTSLAQAEKWRATLVAEISSRITDINNPDLNEIQVRDLNDDINKKVKERRAWEHHIKRLGGADHLKHNADPGVEVAGVRYYGRARELPDVKQVLEAQHRSKVESHAKRRLDDEQHAEWRALESRVTPEYFGYDEPQSKPNIMHLVKDVNTALGEPLLPEFDQHSPTHKDDISAYERKMAQRLAREPSGQSWDFPSSEEVAAWLLDNKKQQLYAKLRSTS